MNGKSTIWDGVFVCDGAIFASKNVCPGFLHQDNINSKLHRLAEENSLVL